MAHNIDKNSNFSLSDEATVPEFPSFMNPYQPYSENRFYHDDVIQFIKKRFDLNPSKKFIVLQGNPGTGKSSTLKQIGKQKYSLGENYVPIYLNAINLIGLNADELTFSLFKNILAKLSDHGYPVTIPDLSEERRRKGDSARTLYLLSMTADSNLEDNKALVLIFDEMDRFLEKADLEAVDEIIRYLQNLEKSWERYALILSSDKPLNAITGSKIIKNFVSAATTIDIEDTLNEETARRLITEPVKERVTFDEDAIKKIILYSGKNLYFQQLICFYTLNYLLEINRDHCTSDDVEVSIARILHDERPEFEYAWENKLSWKNRLLASALADPSITVKKGDTFVLQENELLGMIFGDTLESEIKKLHNFGYISKIEHRHFYKYPIKPPLYATWLKKEHPFIKTVIRHIDIIADRIDFGTLVTEIKKMQGHQLLPFNFDKDEILKTSRKWLTLKNQIITEKKAIEKRKIKQFLNQFATLLSLESRSKGSDNYFTLDIKELRIGILDKAFCFIQNRPRLTREDISNLENTAAAQAEEVAKTRLSLFFYFRESEMIKNLAQKKYLNLIVVDENDLKKVFFSQNPSQAFKRALLSKLSLQRISPYKTAGPVKAIFYGRSDIVDRITGNPHTSYSIVGARKIGKTSLLLYLANTPPPNTFYIYMDADLYFTGSTSYTPFLKSIQRELKATFNKLVKLSKSLFGWDMQKLPDAVSELAKGGKTIIFLIDEIDGLIEFDQQHDYKLLRTFRTMSQKGYCQFIFAGFKVLYHRKRDLKTPLYNFCEEIRLEPLDKESAIALITHPMENIGIHYTQEADKELILEYTARHPNLLQYFCKNLVDRIEKHPKPEDRRTIFRSDIDQLVSDKYEKYIIDEVYMFFSDVDDLNKLIVVQFIEYGSTLFSIDNIKEELNKHRIEVTENTIYRLLRNLVIRFILLDVGDDEYCFALPYFPEILKKRIDSPFKIRLIKELRQT